MLPWLLQFAYDIRVLKLHDGIGLLGQETHGYEGRILKCWTFTILVNPMKEAAGGGIYESFDFIPLKA